MGYKAVEILPFKRTQSWKDIEDRTPLEDFSSHGQPWEHPDISGLGKDTHISYREIDWDGDDFIFYLFDTYWKKWILSHPELYPELSDSILELDAMRIVEEKTRNLEIVIPEEIFKHVSFYCPFSTPEELTDSARKYRDNAREKVGEEKPDSPIALNEFKNSGMSYLFSACEKYHEVVENKFKKIIFQIIRSDISITKTFINDCLEELENPHRDDEGKVIFDDHYYRQRYQEGTYTFKWRSYINGENKDNVGFLKKNGNHLYELSLALFPSCNIPNYFHDKMLFLNDMQKFDKYDISVENKEREILLVSNKTLLKQTKNISDKDLEFCLDRMFFWWTSTV